MSPFDASRVNVPDDERVHVYTVTELTRLVKATLESSFGTVWVTGEISNYRPAASGHAYFTLKDANCQLSVVMFRSSLARVPFRPEDGLEVIVTGEMTVYPARGNYQVIARKMTPKGAGALELALRQLREKLAGQGLFDPERKRELPRFPERMAVVTSPTGAAVRDILRVLGRRWPAVEVVLFPTRVQGDGASLEIARAIADANEAGDFDVMIVGRGGGSLEDLWAFNEEPTVRAVATSKIPVISAVGHETDVTLCDLAADRRALTPTEAAELAVPDARDMADQLAGLAGWMARSMAHRLDRCNAELKHVRARLQPEVLRGVVQMKMQRLDDVAASMTAALKEMAADRRATLNTLGARLEALNPLAVLRRGYSVTRRADTGKVILTADGLAEGAKIETLLESSRLLSTIEKITDR